MCFRDDNCWVDGHEKTRDFSCSLKAWLFARTGNGNVNLNIACPINGIKFYLHCSLGRNKNLDIYFYKSERKKKNRMNDNDKTRF